MIRFLTHIANATKSALRDVNLPKRSEVWAATQKEFLSKNSFCAICATKDKLQVHHIKPFHIFPELELASNNLITLCMAKYDCHLYIGHGGYFKAYNPMIHSCVLDAWSRKFKIEEIQAKAKLNRVEFKKK